MTGCTSCTQSADWHYYDGLFIEYAANDSAMLEDDSSDDVDSYDDDDSVEG